MTGTVHPMQRQDPYYRAYLISDDNKVERATELVALSDEDALAQARQMLDGHAIELWDRARLVVRLPAKD